MQRAFVLFAAFGFALPIAFAANMGSVELRYPDSSTNTFDSTLANFGPGLSDDGVAGLVVLANPLNACIPIQQPSNQSHPSVAVIERGGGCEFGEKVLNAQKAGFIAVIVFDNVAEDLIVMSSEKSGFSIPSVFVSQASGELLKSARNGSSVALSTVPAVFPPYLITFITVVASGIVILSVFMFYRYRRRHNFNDPLLPILRPVDLVGVPYDPVKFKDSTQCCICLEEFNTESTVAELPCKHVFHKSCVEVWLTQKSSCPLCKQDPAVTETTPLLARNARETPQEARAAGDESQQPANVVLAIPDPVLAEAGPRAGAQGSAACNEDEDADDRVSDRTVLLSSRKSAIN